MNQPSNLKRYRVLLREELEPESNDFAEFNFDCDAEDPEHAREQAVNAYPCADVVRTEQREAICACSACREMLYEGDALVDLHVYKNGELNYILLAHAGCRPEWQVEPPTSVTND